MFNFQESNDYDKVSQFNFNNYFFNYKWKKNSQREKEETTL